MDFAPPTVQIKTSPAQVIGMLLALLAVIGGVTYAAFAAAAAFAWLARPETGLAAFLVGASVGELAALAVLAWRHERPGAGTGSGHQTGVAWRWVSSSPSCTAG